MVSFFKWVMNMPTVKVEFQGYPNPRGQVPILLGLRRRTEFTVTRSNPLTIGSAHDCRIIVDDGHTSIEGKHILIGQNEDNDKYVYIQFSRSKPTFMGDPNDRINMTGKRVDLNQKNLNVFWIQTTDGQSKTYLKISITLQAP